MKKLLLFIVVFLALGLALAAGYLKWVLPDVAAAPEIKVPSDPAEIERGRYLAHHVAVCMDCHSERDWSLYSGPIKEGTLGSGGEYFGPEMGFPGKFYAKNLTPDHLSKWTDGEIFRAITAGVDKDGKALFPVMPYPYYSKMDEADVKAIIAYIRTLPSIDKKTPASEADFPMNFILNTIPKNPSLGKRPDPAQKVAYGEYLVNMSACMECHTPVNKGQVILEKAYSGGREFITPQGTLRAPNITPDAETGIGSWSEHAFVQRFKSYASGERTGKVAEGQFNTLMPWSMYAGMDDTDLEAIYAYLHSLKPVKNEVRIFEAKKGDL